VDVMDSNVIEGVYVPMLCIISSSNQVVKNFAVKTN